VHTFDAVFSLGLLRYQGGDTRDVFKEVEYLLPGALASLALGNMMTKTRAKLLMASPSLPSCIDFGVNSSINIQRVFHVHS